MLVHKFVKFVVFCPTKSIYRLIALLKAAIGQIKDALCRYLGLEQIIYGVFRMTSWPVVTRPFLVSVKIFLDLTIDVVQISRLKWKPLPKLGYRIRSRPDSLIV